MRINHRHAGAIVRLAVPMTSASAVIAFAQLVVMGMLGHLGHQALYVRAAYTPIVFAFLALDEGLAASTQVAAAVSHGRDAPHAGMATAGRLLAFALLGAVALAGACWLLAGVLAGFVGAPASAAGTLRSFARWMPAASVLALIPVSGAATLQGFGRAGAAAAVTVTFVAVDLTGVAVAAFVLHRGILSLAWGASIGALAASALGAALLVRSGLWRPRGLISRMRAPGGGAGDALALLRTVGLPIVASYVALFAYGLLVIRILRQFGPNVVAGFSVGYAIQTLAIVPAIALGSAGAIVANRLRGSGGQEAGAVYTATLALAGRAYLAIAAVVTALGLVAPRAIAASAGVASAARTYLLVCGPALAALGVVLVTLTMLEQTGAGRRAVALNVVYVALVAGIGAVIAHLVGSPIGLYATIAAVPVTGLPIVVTAARRHVARLDAAPDHDVGLEPVGDANRAEVHELFASPGFCFKTQLSWLAGPEEIDALLSASVRAIRVDGQLAGLVELEAADAGARHYRLHYRMSDGLPVARWSSVLEAIMARERDERHALRVTYLIDESDPRGLALAERCGLDFEGALPGMVERDGRREARRFYARTYAPDRISQAAEGRV